jgi:hypothetical protein
VDTLTVKGISKQFDGVYECDIVGMLTLTSDEALTQGEAHLIKRMSGARGNEIVEAFLAGDADVRAALAIIVLARNNKVMDERMLEPLPVSVIQFEFGEDAEVEVPPTSEGDPETTEDSPSPNGGKTSGLTLARPETDPEVIGVPA